MSRLCRYKQWIKETMLPPLKTRDTFTKKNLSLFLQPSSNTERYSQATYLQERISKQKKGLKTPNLTPCLPCKHTLTLHLLGKILWEHRSTKVKSRLESILRDTLTWWKKNKDRCPKGTGLVGACPYLDFYLPTCLFCCRISLWWWWGQEDRKSKQQFSTATFQT